MIVALLLSRAMKLGTANTSLGISEFLHDISTSFCVQLYPDFQLSVVHHSPPRHIQTRTYPLWTFSPAQDWDPFQPLTRKLSVGRPKYRIWTAYCGVQLVLQYRSITS